MKRFDKGYVYYSLLSNLFSSFFVVFVFLQELFIGEETGAEDIVAALPIFAIAMAVVYLGLTAYSILYYRTSGYELAEREIKCKRGVLFRKRSVLEYTKIHAVNKKQNIIHKLFGIAILTIDSGSTNTSHQAEILIIEKAKTVDALMAELNLLKEGEERAISDQAEEVLLSDKDDLYRFTSKKKMLYTLINIASSLFFTAIFGVFSVIVIGACKLALQIDVLGTWGQYFLYSLLITVGAMLLVSVFAFIGSIINSFIGYHNFSVTRRGGDIQISFGLLERHTNTFSYDKIKAVKISQGFVQRMLGFASIKLEVIGYVNDSQNDRGEDIGVLVPFCKYDEVGEILGRILPDYIPDEKQTKAVSYFPFVSWFCLILGIVIAAVELQTIVSLLVFNVSSSVIIPVALAIVGAGVLVLAVKLWSAALCYCTNGIAVSGGKVTAYYGGFTKNVTVFMKKNLISAESVTTPLRERAGIASIVMHLKTNASTNEVKVHIQDASLAKELEQLLIL